MFVSSLSDLYKAEYLANGGTEENIDSYTTQALTRKIKEKFGDKVSITLFNTHAGNFLYSSSISVEEGKENLQSEKEKYQTLLRSAALYLRNEIMGMSKWKTPTPTSAETLKSCSPDLPEDLMLFFRTLLCGLRKSSNDANKSNVDRKVMAMSSDAVFNTSRGSIRPWKQTALGLGIGSALVLRTLNRLGHCLSYDEVKSLETEFAYSAKENECETPDGIKFMPELATGLAWDNYDVNMETLDGKDTLHATVGICYQNMPTETSSTEPIQLATRNGKSRRQFDGNKEQEIAPMHRLLCKAEFDLPASDSPQETATTCVQRMIDFYWLMLFQVKPQPLFVGFFSQFLHDDLPKQKICYMDPIPLPPTRNNVVRETMNRSMQVATETKQNYGVVTYDLAVALKAYSIQSLEAPAFDRLLILLGNFHVELAFYGAIGTYINESGAEHMLTENGILAEGSLNGFIRGKYYNRCSRVHDILATAMERKLYQSFLLSLSLEKRNAMSNWLQDSTTREPREMKGSLETDQMFREHMEEYEKFFADAMQGAMGKTAQYWCGYIFMINRVHRDLMLAVRMNDVEAYIAILPRVIDVFFGLNRPNYARWGVLYLQKLRSVDPQIRSILEKGAFSIRRTSKDLSRTAVHLTLEQTINRDAASPMRGIVGFHNNFNAIQRWCVTSTQRGMMVTELRRLTGLQPEEQPRSQLHPTRVEKDNKQITIIQDALSESCDPFLEPATSSPYLMNIATGKVASATTQKYLLDAITDGHNRHEKFRSECAEDNSRLLKPITRRKVDNFASGNKKPKKSSAAARYTSGVVSQRDSFIRMMVVISETTPNFNLQHVLSYPITDVPLAIAHPDGSRVTTPKSALLQSLEKMQEGIKILQHIDVTVIDGGLLLHSFLSAIGSISTYSNLARRLLVNVCCNPGREVHVLFDKYLPCSLKGSERKSRGANDQPFIISGSEQSPKQSCKRLLQNGTFKDQLGKFLIAEWQKEQYGPILGSKSLIISYGGQCVRIKNSQADGTMSVEHPPQLQGKHEEADTLLAFHTANVLGSVLVRVSDTDVFVILIGMLGRDLLEGKPLKSVVVDCGSGNTRRYIDLTSIVNALESKRAGLPAALPGIHAFTGCDFTAAFYRRGKTKPLEVVEEDSDGKFVKFFQDLTTRAEPSLQLAEEYVCSLYAVRDAKGVDKARHIKMVQMTGKINKENPMENIKKVDCALLPPCKTTLVNKVARAHYVSIFWGNADSPEPDQDLDPTQYGWKLEDGHYKFDWFSGSAAPEDLFVQPTNGGNDRACDRQPEEDEDEEFDDDDELAEDSASIDEFTNTNTLHFFKLHFLLGNCLP